MPCTMNLKFSEAKQAKEIYQNKNIKRKLYKTSAAIWYNKICRLKRLTPTYINIHINGNNKQCRRTQRAATQYRLDQEIKFLYTKKQKLNEQLYKLFLICADSWQNIWPIIRQNIDDKLTQEMEIQYGNLNRKLDTLQAKQRRENTTSNQQEHFYPRTANLTKIKFSREELSLLNHGLQHSIEKPLNTYWTDLIM